MTARPVRRTGIWLLVAFSYLASAIFVGWRLLGPSDGAPLPFYSDGWLVTGVRVSPPTVTPGGLQPGDIVAAINGTSVSDWLASALNPVARDHAADLTYTVQRATTTIDVRQPLTRADISAALADNWSNLLFGGVLLAVALYVLSRRPELSASAALGLIATGAGASITPWLLGLTLSDIYFGWPFLLHMLTVTLIYMLLWPGGVHMALALAPAQARLPQPTGRVLWLIYAIPLGAYVLALVTSLALSPTLTAWVSSWAPLQGIIVIACLTTGLAVGSVSYLRASTEVRRQVRWVLIGGAFATIVGTSLLYVPQLLTGRPLVSWNIVGLLALPLPVALAIAIVRDRLFDIEVVVNRTLVYGGVTLAIIAIYALTVAVLSALVPLGGGFPAQLMATGLAAVAALPIRDALQRTVNRLMYGDRDEPYRALSRLAERLESTIEPLAIPSAVVASVAEGLRLPYVAIEIGPADAVELTATHGKPVADTRTIPLVYGSEPVGRLILGQRARNEPFSPGDLRLLDDLARSAGAAVHAVRLTLDVVRARERLVVAREEERRRIRRDLHDGLGPTLAAIGMRAEVAADLAGKDPSAAESTLSELSTEVTAALAEIRRLVDGLRPPSLDERGLVGAIQAQADRLGPQPAFDVSAQAALPELPAAIEVAAYRIAVEAMTNAARHSGAHECRVLLAVVKEPSPQLRIDITDDGRGLPDEIRPGIGLASMRERAAEVGGSIELRRGDAGGTTVTARLPLTLSMAPT